MPFVRFHPRNARGRALLASHRANIGAQIASLLPLGKRAYEYAYGLAYGGPGSRYGISDSDYAAMTDYDGPVDFAYPSFASDGVGLTQRVLRKALYDRWFRGSSRRWNRRRRLGSRRKSRFFRRS